MNKKILLPALLAAITATGCATAGPHHGRHYNDYADFDRARVIKSEPIYETVTVNYPETRCWDERVYYRDDGRKSHTPTIAGAILGGVVGNQFGGGRGKDAMTVAGAILGGSIGNDIANDKVRTVHRSGMERRCETVDNYVEHEEIVGYNVKYRYHGKVHWTRMDREPGEYIKVRVSVKPAHF
ncbi:MAG: glycine zipper 2TM domain-containing protein [Chromatiales bacterium]|jgi:uncharacterized protein YcfJ